MTKKADTIRSRHRHYRRLFTIFMAIVMVLSGVSSNALISYGKETKSPASHTSYAGEQNALTDEQYDAFGLNTDSPALFGEDGSEQPLADFEPLVYSELFVGYGNKSDSEHGAFMVMNETDTLSADAFNINNMDDHLIGNQVNQYQSDRKLQTRNSCPIDADGDGVDEILETSLYIKNNTCYQDIQLYYLKDGVWTAGKPLTYQLAEQDDDFLTNIEADTIKGYVSLTSGDYDDDGKDEAAVYVPKKVRSDDVSIYDYVDILILEVNEDMSLKEKTYTDSNGSHKLHISAANFDPGYSSSRFCYNYHENSGKGKDLLPVANLMTTDIAGRDDLVINVSQPLSGDIKSDQASYMGIYHFHEHFGEMKPYFEEKYMVYGNHRMRFSSAVQADIDGNGVDELVVGGYQNYGWDNANDPGDLSRSENMIQVYTWNENLETDILSQTSPGQYESVWDSPKDITAYGPASGEHYLRVDLEQMEPAAMAAGRLHSNNDCDQVFLEGIIFRFDGANAEGKTQKDLLKDGYFSKEHSIDLGGDNNPFISAAEIATFSTAGGLAEQLVVLSGDHQSVNDDNIYYDISWTWESSGHLTTSVTNDNYIDRKDEDDGGTFMSLCALNADNDTVYVEYTGKEYGWSAPELYCVIQSVPYWRELQYNSEGFGAGFTSFEMSTGTGTGYEGDWALGGGIIFDISAIGGVSFMGSGAMNGGGGGFSLIAQYVNTYSESIMHTESYETSVAAGEDYAVIFAVPVVTYNYDIWIPDYKVTDADVKTYEEFQKNDPTLSDFGYKAGDTIPAHNEECSIDVTLNPTIAHMTLEEYNEAVEDLSKQKVQTDLHVITKDMLADKTIGDPSSYPSSEAELKHPGNVENLFISSKSANVVPGEAETAIGYNIEEETESGEGFNIAFDLEGYWKGKVEVSLFAGGDLEWELGGQAAADGGASWIDSSSKGMSFSSTFKDLPTGTSNAYKFNSNLAVYNMKLSADGSNPDMPYVIGYTVSEFDKDDLPPGLPDDLHVLAATENEVMLRWETVTGARAAKSYAVYGKDNLGEWKKIGITNYPYYKVTNLEANTQYQYALVSYSEKDGKGNASVMSAPVTAITAESNAAAPSFKTQPHSVIVNPGDSTTKTFEAEAVMGEGMEAAGAKLTYQWQKYNPNVQDRLGAWEDIDGATDASLTLPTITEEDGKYKGSDGKTYDENTRYRLVATQTLGGDIHSVYSNSVTMFITDKEVETKDTTLKLTINKDSLDDIYSLEDSQKNYVIKDDVKTIKFDAVLKDKDDKAFKAGSKVALMQRAADNTEKQIASGTADADGKVTFTVKVADLNDSNELYAMHEGSLDIVGNKNIYYMPAVSGVVSLYCVETYPVSYDLDGGFNDVRNPSVLTNHSAVATLYPASKVGHEFKGWQLSDGTSITEINPKELSADGITLYAQWEKIPDDSDDPTDPSGGDSGNNQTPDDSQTDQNAGNPDASNSTGDDMNPAGWCLAGLAAVIVAAAVVFRRRNAK